MNPFQDLKKGDIVTIIQISDWFAHTVRQTIFATGESTPDGKAIFKESSRARKRFTLRPLTNEQLVFINLPAHSLTLDSEAPAEHRNGMSVTSFSGNACFNFMQTPLEIQAIIETCNVNPLFNQHHAILSHATKPAQLAYPERYVPGVHAVIDQRYAQK